MEYNAEFKKIGNMLMFHPDDVNFYWENGKVGLIKSDGSIFHPAEFNQIEVCEKYIYFLKDGLVTLYQPTHIRSWNLEYETKGYIYAYNGKLGWKDSKGEILIPAKYDEISRWGEDVYEVLSGDHWHYINGDLMEILTDFTQLEGDEDDEPPFDLYHPNNKVLTVQEYIGHKVNSDPNVINLDGTWVRLCRKTGREISEMLVNSEDECPMTEDNLRLFNNSFSYEYGVYLMHSKSEKGVCDCLRQACRMGAYNTSWYYLVKVWKAPGMEPSAGELRAIRYSIAKSRQLGRLEFALGHDCSLEPRETKMIIVTHYNERCFPPDIEFDWTDFLNEKSLDEITAYIPVLKKTIEETYLPEYIKEVWWDMLHDRINDINYDPNRSWEETERVIGFFKKDDTSYLRGVNWCVERFMDCDTSKTDPYIYINKLKWLLENDANVNFIERGETGLDLLNKKPDTFLNKSPVTESMIEECKQLMRQHGALTMKELIREESQNTDYQVELSRMN